MSSLNLAPGPWSEVRKLPVRPEDPQSTTGEASVVVVVVLGVVTLGDGDAGRPVGEVTPGPAALYVIGTAAPHPAKLKATMPHSAVAIRPLSTTSSRPTDRLR